MKLKLLLIVVTLLLSTLLFSGCGPTKLYLIDKEDIIAVESGETYKAPKQGWFVSDYWLKEIGKAKVEKR